MFDTNLIQYFYKKLVAAGFSFSIFMFIYTLFSSVSIFELSQALRSPWLWIAFYVYGVISSIIIDRVIKIWPQFYQKSFIIYAIFGVIPFIFMMSHIIYVMIAGFVGCVAALFFYFGLQFVTKNKWIAITFSLILPLLLVFVSNHDFTKKINWRSEQYQSSFEASFSYFNGEHKIPIELAKGDKLTYTVTFNAENEGGWGNHFENEKGKNLPMAVDGEFLEYDVEKDKSYFIVVSGHRVRGSFKVDWEILKSEK